MNDFIKCNEMLSNYKINNESNFRKVALELKKNILNEGKSDFENDERYKQLFHHKNIIENYLKNKQTNTEKKQVKIDEMFTKEVLEELYTHLAELKTDFLRDEADILRKDAEFFEKKEIARNARMAQKAQKK